jgi:uncharacterized membrane protein YraQ (UPF0718 family)
MTVGIIQAMLRFLTGFAYNTWDLVAEMAPYLLFGFAVAGALHVLIRKDFVQRWLGKPGLGGVIKASVLGVPMPLCSCSVIPVAASLRKSGATRGATASFLSSTPQTGVDSILATYALLGGLFTAVRVTVAFVTGIVTGYLIELFCENDASAESLPRNSRSVASISLSPLTPPAPLSPQSPMASMGALSPVMTPLAGASEMEKSTSKACCCSAPSEEAKRRPMDGVRYAFLTLPADLANALMIGLVLAGLITTLMPTDLLTGSLSTGPLAFLLATAISLPLYVCATASIPMAYALMAAGLSPGAALVFLIAGPATNTATIVTVWKMLGRGATMIYLASLLVISWLAGWLFNTILSQSAEGAAAQTHEMMRPGLWQHGSGVLLIGLLIFSVWKAKQSNSKSCCAA